MTEVVVSTDPGKKRRLPSWMERLKSANEKGNYCETNGCSLSEKKPDMLDGGFQRNSIAKIQKNKPTDDVLNLSEPETVGSNKAAQRKTKTSKINVAKDNSLSKHETAKTNTEEDVGTLIKVAYETAAKTKVRKSKRQKCDEVVCPPAIDNEIEITVNDLVRIAEEYVTADRQRQLECLTSKEHQLQTHPSISSVSSVCGPHMVSGSNKALSRCTDMPTSNHSTCHLYEAKNTESETSAANIPQTGDPAQDMLDLLLGPLLKKPKSEEHETATFLKEHFALSYTTIKPSTARKEIWKNDAVLTKKKSSLRDKVAMLLD